MIDFQALKQAVSFADAVDKLGLELKPSGNQMRGVCPACKAGGDRALVVTEGKGFFCFAAQKGGDVIALAAHILDVSVKDAAQFLAAGTVTTSKVNTSTSTSAQEVCQPVKAPPPPVPAPEDNRLEKVGARLLHEHQEVQALGLTPEMAEELGIGYDKRGVLRGRVLFPLYKDGELAGFMGYAADLVPLIKFPNNLTEEKPTNVVPLHKAG